MSEYRTEDTIAAVATPAGAGGIAVIRVSGPAAFEIAARIFIPQKGELAEFLSHTIHAGTIRHSGGGILDQALAGVFRAPHSYTGEDVIEISSHGGIFVTRAILDLLIQNGARHAEPGEFTKRAFLNGKMDLVQAEAVLDLIKAKSEKSLQTAIRQLTGSLSARFKILRGEMLRILAHSEACLDFPDEHLDIFSDDEFRRRFEKVRKELEDLIASFKRGNALREGVSVVLVGKPNVGKSSLFNALLARDRALVSEYPGTTRDRLEEAVEIGGWYLRLVDTAGLNPEAGHPVERLGIEETRRALEAGRLFLYLMDGSQPFDDRDRAAFCEIENKSAIVVVNKCDLPAAIDFGALARMTREKNWIKISTKTREGIADLEKEICGRLAREIAEGEDEGEQVTRLRHKNLLELALASFLRAEKTFSQRESLEFAAVDLRAALDFLRELVGEVYSEDLLDVIFAEFCIGK